MSKIIKTLFILIVIAAGSLYASGTETGSSHKLQLNKNWFIKSSLQVQEDGSVISTSNYSQIKWYSVDLPSSVLSGLIRNGVYPDTRQDMNEFLIPDASDEFNAKNNLARYSYLGNNINPFKDPYWFRKEFTASSEYKDKTIWLNFDGINYRADVWLNGRKVADSSEMYGMFRRFKYNVTKFIKAGEKNYLAVKIYQVDHPGTPNTGVQQTVFGPNRGWSTDIFKDETLKFSGGWDCAPVVRDRNMGIYQDVYLTATGPALIENPYIITELPLPDTTKAMLTVSAEIKNITGEKIKGVLKGKITLINELIFPTYTKKLGGKMAPVNFEKEIELNAGETLTVEFCAKDYPQLNIDRPYLWYPNGYGKQYLHNLNLSFDVNGKASDAGNTTFGIRQVENKLIKIKNEYARTFYINGKRIFCRGGWIQSEILQDQNVKRAYDEARLLAEANVNMIANEDAPSPPDYIMDTYDKYGLMVWETFYQCWRMYPGTETEHYPLDDALALKNAQDIIKRYRNHPSLVLWCVACETTVDEELYVPLKKYVKELDRTRPFVPTSSYDWNVDSLTPYIKDDLPLGMTDAGSPDYTWNPEAYYFNKILEVDKQTFRNELGVPSVPVLSSLKKFVFNLGKEEKTEIFPLDSVWAHHGAWDDNHYAFRAYDSVIRYAYGTPSSVEDYVRKAQYVNANSYRAMFEAANHRMWDITSGVMLWKLNDCWPSVLWQIYDWYLCPNAAYYFTKKALEPVHIQMNANDFTVSVINTGSAVLKNHTAEAEVIDMNLNTSWSSSVKADIEGDRYKEFFKIPRLSGLTNIYFVRLKLKNENGAAVSENLYWMSSSTNADYADLNELPFVKPVMMIDKAETEKEYKITIKLKNDTKKLSFFNRIVVEKGKGGEEVLPAFWSDNYITLFPGEEKTVAVTIAKEDLGGKEPYITFDKSGILTESHE